MSWNLLKTTTMGVSNRTLIALLAVWSLSSFPLVLSQNMETRKSIADVGAVVEGAGSKRLRLFQYDPVKVGHIRYIEVSPGRFIQLKTIAVKPPAFEIPNFLSPEECERIKELALNAGLATSTTVYRDLGRVGIDKAKVSYNAAVWIQKLAKCDSNSDKTLDSVEVLRCIPGLEEGEVVPPSMLQNMYLKVKLDLDSDGLIDAKELWLMNLENKTVEIKDWLTLWRKGEVSEVQGRGRNRISQHTWLDWATTTDPLVTQLIDRVTALTKLDRNIILSSDEFQVVHYHPGGYYHAHYDSNKIDENKECAHISEGKNQERMCRFMTILYYLQDTEGGGETAFPLAEFENISKEYLTQENLGYDYVDLNTNCYKNLHVKPEYGKAIMWYNHHIDEETGWLSSQNKYSVHGGCAVTKGTKWIANNWITVDNVYERQMEFQARVLKPKEDGSLKSENDRASHEANENVVAPVTRSPPSSKKVKSGETLPDGHIEL
ncbi:transmembrane prolyl 4-hydroxylase-like [Lytechinus variegatus]|uniref:transmembrane prolyl 4-hydroxylase-like n=1 Tax=Lytechinus variegatus TaxID=7654 RepID=UPI001BB1EDDA|nr:transmembrane prolyl 4-hydroxylase-like [Lytechinus variegatus]